MTTEITKFEPKAKAIARTDIGTLETCIRLLDGWQPADRMLPAGVTGEMLIEAREQAEACLRPTTKQDLAVATLELFAFARTFGIRDFDNKEATRFYEQTLLDCPADLLRLAVHRITQNYRYGHRLPTPGDIREQIENELQWRKDALWGVTKAIRLGTVQQARKVPA